MVNTGWFFASGHQVWGLFLERRRNHADFGPRAMSTRARRGTNFTWSRPPPIRTSPPCLLLASGPPGRRRAGGECRECGCERRRVRGEGKAFLKQLLLRPTPCPVPSDLECPAVLSPRCKQGKGRLFPEQGRRLWRVRASRCGSRLSLNKQALVIAALAEWSRGRSGRKDLTDYDERTVRAPGRVPPFSSARNA